MYVGYLIADDGTSAPVCVCETGEEALNRAIVRCLGMGCSEGEIKVQNRDDLSEEDLTQLRDHLDKFFQERDLPL